MENNELLLVSIADMINNMVSKKEEYSDTEKRKIAYALNMCTVSVGQIIEYSDVVVLDQEYDTILNNLNLQEMPKDDAFLNVFSHLMDTITFFRIYEEERKFIETEYQQKVKNAIWGSVSSLSILTNFSSPLSIATSIGISYMNYRRSVADYSYGKDRDYWNLQKTAIEQLNGLQRELFSCMWKIEEKYDIPDEYRLTERQIKQYNEILKDQDMARRFDRLESISSQFEAYGPFWYFMGNAANEVYHDREIQESLTLSDEQINTYRENAIMCFDKFIKDSDFGLLRDNPLISSCALEYIDILSEMKEPDQNRIKSLIDLAKEKSGYSNDILELCAFAYLRNHNIEEGLSVLKYLVNEQYNETLNAQLLSRFYAELYVKRKDSNYLDYRKNLSSRATNCYLFPIPRECSKEEFESAENDFIEYQKRDLRKRYHYVLTDYIRKCDVEFERLFQQFGVDGNSPIGNAKKEYLGFFNGIIDDIKCLAFVDSLGTLSRIKELLEQLIKMYADRLLRPYRDIDNKDDEVHDVDFNELTFAFFAEIARTAKDSIVSCTDLSDLADMEENLFSFSNSQRIIDPFGTDLGDMNDEEDYLKTDVFGEAGSEDKQYMDLYNKMKKCIDKNAEGIIKPGTKTKCLVNEGENKAFYDRFFNRKNKSQYRSDTIAIISDGDSGDDIILTTKGIVRVTKIKPYKSDYSSAKWARNGKDAICISSGIFNTNRPYNNNDVKMENLLSLFKELSEIRKSAGLELQNDDPCYVLLKGIE